MGWVETLLLALGALLGLMALGLPVFVAFLIVNLLGIVALFGTRAFGLFANSIYETATSESLVAIPLFILLGEILFRSGSVDVLFRAIDTLVGRIRGRLYVVVVALSTAFGALSGSAVAVAAMLGRSLLPRMRTRGYDAGLSSAVILGGASLAPIIPPSLLVVVVGSLVKNVSIAGLLIAGIGPGLLLGGMMLAYVAFRVWRRPALAPQDSTRDGETAAPGLREVAHALVSLLPFTLVILSVMGFILAGIATPSESAATGVLAAVLVAAIYRRLSLAMLGGALWEAARLTAIILVIVASSKLFGQVLSFSGATRGLVTFVTTLELAPWLMLLLLMLVPFVICMFVDQIAFLLLAIPLYEPIMQHYGFDPIWFWTLFLINLTIGSLTPPFGYTLFALKGAAAELSIAAVFRAAWPVVAVFVFGLLLLALAPGIVTFLPSQF